MNDPARCADLFTQSETRWSAPLPRILPSPSLISALARAFAAGEPDAELVAARGAEALGRPWRFLNALARRYVEAFGSGMRPRHREVVRFLQGDKRFGAACVRYAGKLFVADWLAGERGMRPAVAASLWEVRPVASLGELAEWLGLDAGELDWFADLRGLEREPGLREELRHYRCRAMAKRSGGFRLIESPKRRLKEIQRKILVEVLDRVPAHPTVHGFVKGRSIQTFAAPHVGKSVVLRLDLAGFFPSITGARVQSVFRLMGYPESVADRLGGLCTNATPRGVWSRVQDVDACIVREACLLYSRPHLPQGAPCSPALANLCAYRMDCRLSALAEASGAVYTRYADDLAFSGDAEFARGALRFAAHIAVIVREEGFAVNHCKTRIMRRGVRQHLAGLVVNDRLNVRRAEYDRLKAILTNCVRKGPTAQNRENHPFFSAHLEGRVSFFASVNPGRGRRLRMLLKRIDWSGLKDGGIAESASADSLQE